MRLRSGFIQRANGVAAHYLDARLYSAFSCVLGSLEKFSRSIRKWGFNGLSNPLAYLAVACNTMMRGTFWLAAP